MEEVVDVRTVKAVGITVEQFLAEAAVNKGIADAVVPELYHLINELLIHEGKPLPKDLKVQAKRALPAWCDQSFQQKLK
jgi:hypothetical protein